MPVRTTETFGAKIVHAQENPGERLCLCHWLYEVAWNCDNHSSMSAEHFRITDDGPALDAHEMDVRDLTPALLSLADACEAARHCLVRRAKW